MSEQPTINVRVNPEVRAAIEAEAERQDRSLSNLVQLILRDYIASLGNNKAGA